MNRTCRLPVVAHTVREVKRRSAWREWLPLALLLLGLSTIHLFGENWGHFVARHNSAHDKESAKNLAIAENLSPRTNFRLFRRLHPGADGEPVHLMYSRFPVGGYALIKLAILPFGDDPSAKLYAGRLLMLLMFGGAALLAYLSLRRLGSDGWIALAATLLAFSSYPVLFYNDMISTEVTMDLFAVMLVFHGMVTFGTGGRLGQLLVKTGAALLLGWHVFGLLLAFIALGLGGEFVRAAKGGPYRIRHIAAVLLRSRYVTLGAVALSIGLCVLSFNFANEYAVLKAGSVAELPSFQSMVRRFGLDPEINEAVADEVAWKHFLSQQLKRIGIMTIPYALSVHTVELGMAHRIAGGGRLRWSLPYEIIGFVALAASLLGALLARRHGMLFAVLPLGGLCWGVLMRFTTAMHKYEAIFYIGIPLTLFALVLMLLQGRRAGGPAVGVAVAALVVFVLSSYPMSRRDAQAAEPRRQEAIMDDFRKIGDVTRGRSVYAPTFELTPYLYGDGASIIYWWPWENVDLHNSDRILEYYLAGSVLQLEKTVVSACGPRCGRDYDFVISAERHDVPALLTPTNRFVFLYDAAGATDLYQAQYDTIVSSAPLARSTFDVHLHGADSIAYVKEPCTARDVRSKFFLHVVPPHARRPSDFVRLDFDLPDYGVFWNNRCLAVVPLPGYAVSRIRTGQFIRDKGQGQIRQIWKSEFSFPTRE